jgi:hypothetical protein
MSTRKGLFGMAQNAFEKMANDMVDSMAKDAKKKLEKPTKTWNHTPNFTIEKIVGRDIKVRISTDDEVYYYLDGGTEVRHALMSNPFEPKTQQRSFKARAGKGKAIKVSRSINKPGIKPRMWTDMVSAGMDKSLRLNVAKLLGRLVGDNVNVEWELVSDNELERRGTGEVQYGHLYE